MIVASFYAYGEPRRIVVVDSTDRTALPSASVFDRNGRHIGLSDKKGYMPYVSLSDYPISVRYMGYHDKSVPAPCDTIALVESFTELDELVVESRRHKVLHMLGYVREYSMLSTFTDTVFLFREKMVDYMLTPDRNVNFREWITPRILKVKSYYRFTNAVGLDSVSDNCNHHFSWSDWIGIPPTPSLPAILKNREAVSDTIRGKYSPTEIWRRNDGKVVIDVDVLADTASRKWVPTLSNFFRNALDFECFKARFNYDNVIDDSISIANLTGYSYNIESCGRGHEMFQFNRFDENYYVSTYAEVYIVDREYITVKEAKKWAKLKLDQDKIEIIESPDAPALMPATIDLIARVNAVNSDEIRLAAKPDHRLMGLDRNDRNFNIGYRALSLLKQLTGISSYRAQKKFNRNWSDFRKKIIDGKNKDILKAPPD